MSQVSVVRVADNLRSGRESELETDMNRACSILGRACGNGSHFACVLANKAMGLVHLPGARVPTVPRTSTSYWT